MYRVSCKPSVVIYVAENKTLAGKEDRAYEGEAMGRTWPRCISKMLMQVWSGELTEALWVCNRSSSLLLSSCRPIGGIAVPADPERTAAHTELLLESLYQGLDIQRIKCTLEPGAPEVHIYSLDDAVPAEAAFCNESPADHRTKMALARALQRNDEFHAGETLQVAWNRSLAELRGRTAHLFPVPAVPPAPAGPAGPPAGRGAGGRGPGAPAPPAGRGRGRGAPAGPAAPPAARGRGRGKGRGGRG